MSQCSKLTFSAMIFLRDNVLLETDLIFNHIKPFLPGILETCLLAWVMLDD